MLTRVLACVLLMPLAAAGGPARAADPVTVYRCVDAKGRVTLGDVPCPKGANEEVRTMQRPKDGPPPVVVIAPAPPPPPMPAPQVVVVRTPQPMYECITPDGQRYTSETADGNPRWVPLWTLGFRSGWGRPGRPSASEATDRLNTWQQDRPLGGHVGAPRPRPPQTGPSDGHRPPIHHVPRPGLGGAPGTWVRDACHALPQAEVCARLVDRRNEIRRRFFNAQESERNVLRVEERGINARLAADCGTR